MKKIFALLFSMFIMLNMSACDKKQDDDIYIVFTNDVHCAIDTNIGYAGVSAYTKELKSQHQYVALVDAGDFASGSIAGSISTGYIPTAIMNETGYDVATFGNHEFDFGFDYLEAHITGTANFDIVCSNIGYTGQGENRLKDIKPYVVKKYGNTSVAFLGVSAVSTIAESTPTVFMEYDEMVYDFSFGDSRDNFYSNLQEVINKAHKEADYVVMLSHLGIAEKDKPFCSYDIAQNTYGVDVIVDGHSHSEILGDVYKNAKNEDVAIWQTGTELNNFGTLILKKDHTIEGMLVSDYEKKDEAVTKKIDELNAEYDEFLNQVICHADFDLTIGENVNDVFFRLVRNRETNLGDLCADAVRYVYSSDIAVVNGGGIRETIASGDIAVKDCVATHPFANATAMIRVSGQTILDMLEYSVFSTLSYTRDDEHAVGEFGGFLQVSGIKFDVDTSIDSPCLVEDEMFVKIDGERRVKNVLIEKNGKYVELDPNEFYTLSGSQYILSEKGNGYTMFEDSEVISKEGTVDTNCLIEYTGIYLNGIIPEEYKQSQGRINIY